MSLHQPVSGSGGGSGGGGGGDGATIYSDTYANIPAAGTEGDLFLPTDGTGGVYRDDGSAWQSWGPLFACTKPVLTDFTWVNQGSAVADQTYGGLYMYGPADSANDSLHILKKSAPSVPWTVTVGLISFNWNQNYNKCGVCYRQSSDGKLVIFSVSHVNSYGIDKYTDPTTYSANYTAKATSNQPPPIIWFRMEDNNTNRICSVSVDGQHFMAFHTVARTDFLTADEVGLFIDARNTGGYPNQMLVVSWGEG